MKARTAAVRKMVCHGEREDAQPQPEIGLHGLGRDDGGAGQMQAITTGMLAADSAASDALRRS